MADGDDGGDSRARRISGPFAKTLHDFSLRVVQRAGRRPFDGYVVLHDIFEQKMAWKRRMLMLTFDTAGEWELNLLLNDGSSAFVAYGRIGDDHGTMGQDMPAFQVPDLVGLVRRIEAQIRLRQEYQHHLS